MLRTRKSGEHIVTTELDHQRGGWVSNCSCGWYSKRPHFYKRDAKLDAWEHIEEGAAANDAPTPEPALTRSGGVSHLDT